MQKGDLEGREADLNAHPHKTTSDDPLKKTVPDIEMVQWISLL